MPNKIYEQLDRIEAMLSSQKEVLRVEELCTLTGWSQSYVYKLSMSREIPHYKVRPDSKILYFKRKEIEEYLTKYRVKTNEELEAVASNYLITKK